MPESLKQMKKIHRDELSERILTVKPLHHDEFRTYEIVKDQWTGEHYLYFIYSPLESKGKTEKERYDQFLPIENDDVLGILFSDQEYRFPSGWTYSYLRNGPDDYYVWYDPSAHNEEEEDAAIGKLVAEKLKSFKQSGEFDPGSVEKLLNDIDSTINNPNKE